MARWATKAGGQWRTAVALVALVVVAGIWAWWVGGRNKTPAPRAPSAAPQPPPQQQAAGRLEAKGAEVEEKDAQGRLLWRLKAQGRFTADKEAGRASGEQVRWELVTPDHRWLAEARAVQLDYRARRALFTGGVQVKSADAPLAFRTGRLVYQMDTGKLVAAGPVELQIHGLTLVAARAVVDTATRELRAHDFRGHCRF